MRGCAWHIPVTWRCWINLVDNGPWYRCTSGCFGSLNMTARSRSSMAFGNYFDFIGYRVLRSQLPCRRARDFAMAFAIINLGRQSDSEVTVLYNIRNLFNSSHGYRGARSCIGRSIFLCVREDVVIFSFRAAFRKSALQIHTVHPGSDSWYYLLSSCAPESSISLPLCGGSKVGLLGTSGEADMIKAPHEYSKPES